jgi:hypothetical protein
MSVLSLIVWQAAILLEALLLYRGFRAKLFSRYPNFYVYILSLFLSDGLLYLVYLFKPAAYQKWAWYAGFLILFLGCGILVEIFRHVLSHYAGVEKFARIGGFAVLGGVLCFAILYPIFGSSGSAAHVLYVRLQRNFLMVQAILLFGLLQLIFYYGISMGKNLKGMIFGYGQCVGTTLVSLALHSYIGTRFEPASILIQQMSYLAALAIWLVAFWSYRADPPPEATIRGEEDYDVLVAKTSNMVGAANTELIKVNRP